VRVHLVLPHREPFARDRQDAQASVMLTMAGAQRLDREGVQAILNLVSAAVPGLTPRNIAVVDSRGDLLARAGQPTGQSSEAASADEVRRATELRLSRAVEEMLEHSLGPGRVRAEASVRMNYDRVNETKESYDPDGQVTRSSQTVTSNSKTTEQNGTVSVQNNLPNADAGAPQGAGTQDGKQEETTNYEIGKTVRTLIREQPQIDRISLAVMVDGTMEAGKIWQPLPADDLNQIATLVKSAIGYDEKRGDQVNVVSMRFAAADTGPSDTGGLWGIRLEKPEVMNLAQTALIGIIGLLALLLVLRPMVKGIVTLAPSAAGVGSMEGEAGSLAFAGGQPQTAGALPGPRNNAQLTGPTEDDSMVDIAQIEGQLRASSLRKLSEMVEKHPSASLNIIRGWMARDNG
jgi:flagellar M-ring protein FliF